jgi:hypothetical protein
VPFALGFGTVTEQWGVHAAGWLLVAVAVAIAVLLVVIRPAATAAPVEAAQECVLAEAA